MKRFADNEDFTSENAMVINKDNVIFIIAVTGGSAKKNGCETPHVTDMNKVLRKQVGFCGKTDITVRPTT